MRCRTLLLVSILAVSGCAAYKIPEQPQSHLIRSSPVPILVRSDSITEYELEHFVGALKKAQGVTVVNTSNDSRRSHIVAELKPEYDGRCFSEPMLTVLTLGVFPSIGCAPHGFRFKLSGGPLAKPTLVDARDEVPSIWGWAALFALLSSDWVGERGLSDYEADHLGEAIGRVVDATSN